MIKIEHLSREIVLQSIYQSYISGIGFEESYDLMLDYLNEEIEFSFKENYITDIFSNIIKYIRDNENNKSTFLLYSKKLILGISEKKEYLLSFLEKNDQSRTLDRLNIAILAIMLISMYEIKYLNEIPYKVAINEALELCSEYAEDALKPYVNSILQTYVDNEI